MNLPYSNAIWQDGDWVHARPCSLPAFSAPLPNTTAQYLLKQDFQQNLNNFSPLAYNTKHPNYSTYVLVEESERRDLGGSKVQWTRTYAQVPSTYSEFETFAYNFIGIVTVTGINIPVTQGRDRFTWRVESRVQYDFFLASSTLTPSSDSYDAGITDGNASPAGPGTVTAPYDGPGSIPFNRQFLYDAQGWDTVGSTWIGGIYYAVDDVYIYTFPTTVAYLAMVDDAFTNKWNSTVSVQNLTKFSAGKTIINPLSTDSHNTPTPNSILGGQLCAEDSQLSRWMGNIWMRRTRYVLAQ